MSSPETKDSGLVEMTIMFVSRTSSRALADAKELKHFMEKIIHKFEIEKLFRRRYRYRRISNGLRGIHPTATWSTPPPMNIKDTGAGRDGESET